MNNNDNKLIPELRFPEFLNEGEWKEKQISNILDYERPDNYIVSDTNYQKSGIPVLTANKSFILGYTNEDFGIYDNLPVIIFDDFTVDNKYVDFPFKVKSSAIKILRIKEDDNLKFIYELISQIEFKGVEHKRYYISEYQNLNVNVPNPTEQQKIADCLSSLDDLISAHTDKLDALKEHKKGLMQNLFPQEGETVPKLRFNEFEKDGEWREKILSQVAHYENGRAHEQDIVENGKYIVVNSKFISSDGETTKYSNSLFCKSNIGDILMVLSDVPNGKAIAKCFYVPEEDKYTVNQRICKISSFDIDSLFLFYIMNRNPYFLSFDDGVKQTNLRNEDVQSFSFLVPKNPKEQQKIADTLSALDALIKEQADKIEQLKQHKKGLMQGLFPKIKE